MHHHHIVALMFCNWYLEMQLHHHQLAFVVMVLCFVVNFCKHTSIIIMCSLSWFFVSKWYWEKLNCISIIKIMCLFSWSFVLQLTSFCEISAFINGNDPNIGKFFFVLLSSSTNCVQTCRFGSWKTNVQQLDAI